MSWWNVSLFSIWAEYTVEALRYKTEGFDLKSLIPDEVIGIFHWHNPFGRTMALGSTQPLTDMINRNISWWVKATGV
jgi:hypothetical protein